MAKHTDAFLKIIAFSNTLKQGHDAWVEFRQDLESYIYYTHVFSDMYIAHIEFIENLSCYTETKEKRKDIFQLDVRNTFYWVFCP